jgi:hypothetical protein
VELESLSLSLSMTKVSRSKCSGGPHVSPLSPSSDFRARISSSLGDLRSDIQRRVRAASNIKHEGAIITNTGGKDRGMTQTVELSWEQVIRFDLFSLV